jgi:hypothetical protein
MNLGKLIISLFCILIAVAALFITKMHKVDSKAYYALSYKETVKAVYPVRGRPLQRTARLNDSLTIDVPAAFTAYIQAGDSIWKESNSNRIVLKSNQLNKTFFTTKR